MNRTMNFLAVMATAGIVALKTTDIPSLLPDPGDVLPFFTPRNVHEYYAFKAQFDDTLLALRNGEASLRDAHRRVKSMAQSVWPSYLSNLRFSDCGTTTDERIARNLVGHIQSIAEFGHVSPARVAELESELAEFLAQHCDHTER